MEQLSTKVLVRASLRPGVTGLPSSVCGVGGMPGSYTEAWVMVTTNGWVRRAVGLRAEQLLLGEPSGCPGLIVCSEL